MTQNVNIALVILMSFSVSSDVSADNSYIEVRGKAMNLFDRGGHEPPKRVELHDSKVIDSIELGLRDLVKSAKAGELPKGIASSLHLQVTLPSGHEFVLVAGRYLLWKDEWRESNGVDGLTTQILQAIAQVEGLAWSEAAVNTKYPSEEEKSEILKRLVLRVGAM